MEQLGLGLNLSTEKCSHPPSGPACSRAAEAVAAPLWVLLGAKRGDNQQLLAIAEALKLPFRVVQLRFSRAGIHIPVVFGASRLSWRCDLSLAPPLPRAVLAAGRRSVPAARWIRHQSGGQTRLIHVNRPWAPLSWFDLIISTPQYGLPQRPNVVANLMPFMPPRLESTSDPSLPIGAAELPRPWTAVLVGGNSRPLVLDESAAVRLAKSVNAEVRAAGGSAWVFDSPRTPGGTLATIERGLEVPSHVVRWQDGGSLYTTQLRLADRFIVTSDSATMLIEALLTGRPVTVFKLPAQPDLRSRIARAWRAQAEGAPASMLARAFEVAVNLGLVTSVRDLDRLHRGLADAGLFDGTGDIRALAEHERQHTLARISQVIESSA